MIERGCTKMKINTINYFIVDALKSIKRNITVSFAAMLTVLVTFFVLGTFTLVGLNFNKTIEDVADKIEIKVYLQDDIKLVNQREVEIKLSEQDGVKAVTYESKDEAFTKLKKDLEGNSGMLEGYSLENNPLASSYIVTLEDASYASNVTKAVEDMTGVESVTNQQELIEKISRVVDFVQILGVILFFVFIGVSIFLIMNTIKLAVYSRRREVGIMKFVGATDWFIRWPFVIEGIIIGAIGSLLATAVLYFIYRGVFGFIASNLLIANLVPVSFVLTTLLGGFLLGGIVVGAIGSIAALRKFLVV
jgi:cell division transport system permease protein